MRTVCPDHLNTVHLIMLTVFGQERLPKPRFLDALLVRYSQYRDRHADRLSWAVWWNL